MPPVKKHYRAFISYSHQDVKWAKWLHRSLERYVVPIDAFTEEERMESDGSEKSRRLTPIFRDRDELPAAGSLSDTIQQALEGSENLIVLCSPNSVASQYVNTEIDSFRGLHPDNEQKIYALIIEGDPPDCFPASLTVGGAEPIAADAREEGDSKGDAKLKLIAGLLGVGFDRLKQREVKRQRNRLLAMVTVVSAVAVMTSVLALWALRAEAEANVARGQAEAVSKANRRQLYLAEMNLASRALEDKSGIGQIAALTSQWLPISDEKDLRDWEWYYLRGQLSQDSLTIQREGLRDGGIAWGPDESKILMREEEGLAIWDLVSGQIDKRPAGWKMKGNFLDEEWSPDGRKIATASTEGRVTVFNSSDFSIVAEWDAHDTEIRSLAWSADGVLLATGGNTEIKTWNAESGDLLTTSSLEDSSDRYIAWSPDQKWIAVASSFNREPLLLNGQSGEIVKRFKMGLTVPTSIDWHPDSRRIAIGGTNWITWVLDVNTAETNILAGHNGSVICVAWSPDGNWFATGDEGHVINLHKAQNGELKRSFVSHTDVVKSISWRADSSQFASLGKDGTVKIWDVENDEVDRRLRGHTNWVNGIEWSPDGSRIVSCGNDKTIRIWDAHSHEELAVLRGHIGRVYSVTWSSDGKRLASYSKDGTARVWGADSGEEISKFDSKFEAGTILDWLGREELLISLGEDNKLLIRHSSSGEIEREIKLDYDQKTAILAVHQSSGRVVIRSDRSLIIYDLERGRELQRIESGIGFPYTVAWSPDGKVIAAATSDHKIGLWDVESGKLMHVLQGHTNRTESLAWHPSGRRLASGCVNGSVRLWDRDTGIQALELPNVFSVIYSVAWSPDGSTLAVGSWRWAWWRKSYRHLPMEG